ncbi:MULTISPECIES: transporter substrate-binding domain-containing protein [Paracoccus]|jgi:polar amino acid transport system substrate-binding protein|uniref:Amino acid ABC transporter substrate-binding protein, PAAT family n=1 Tax=Paracoccus denitrificans (strain Pd 1222) TaxID=318586 RepID=A1B8C8_PARDP|nr:MULTISPECIES: transporter substrate-binding domain-containing protein [Paracoccus]ABL71772.1 amino acid ABC transporter substrate-binding protein, PAAT family [Paracoccus denitrificans PD1222]MBB4628131.1 polar amino acid transport system substrate-binding protein [Paracoccus denitrificans]MCU7429196.1 transporter substrate-binding domain-containing protein [Paracoccus denitrificans]MDK8872759.1 transporter substrate-binding domain-containing protein [Paracoccus sp. SSJ]QAR28361.1 transport
MKKLTLAAAAFALTAGMGMAQTVRIATEGAYPPYNLINDQGQVAGFEVDLGNELCKRAELQCTWVKNDWDSIIPNLVSSNYDAIMAAMSINEERKQVIAFSEDYLPPAPSSYVALDEGANLETGIVAVQTGTVQASHVADTQATMLEYPNIDQVFAAVRNGEADAAFGDHEVMRPFVEDSEDLIFVGEQVRLDEGIGIGVRQSDNELREKLNAAIGTMKQDGSLNELIKKHFGEDAQTYE